VRDKKKFEKIVESIALLGLKRPITVTTGKPADDGGETFDLVCGQGRLEAFIALGQKEIPALVRGFSPTDGLLASLIENIARRRGRALDQIRMIQWMKDQGHSPANIAAKTGLGVEYVKDILNLLSRGEERLLEAVLHGKIPATALAHYPSTSDEEAFQSRAALERDVAVWLGHVDMGPAAGKNRPFQGFLLLFRTCAARSDRFTLGAMGCGALGRACLCVWSSQSGARRLDSRRRSPLGCHHRLLDQLRKTRGSERAGLSRLADVRG